jgi:hypothetical protein
MGQGERPLFRLSQKSQPCPVVAFVAKSQKSQVATRLGARSGLGSF